MQGRGRQAVSLATRRPLGLLLGGVLAIVALAAAVSAIFGSADPPPLSPGGSSFASARDGVCRAADAADHGDPAGARATFFDRSHQALHELAATAQERDRAATARLLEAKERVESGLEKPSPALAEDLDDLGAVTGRAMAAVGSPDPGPCRG